MSPSSAPNRLVYLAFGSETYHQEAFFSIVSALEKLRSTASSTISIHIFSDRKDFYKALPVTVHSLNKESLKIWSQPTGYYFRVKHALLREVLKECETAVLIDTDTFFRASPQALFDRVQAGSLLCNAIGSVFGHDRNAEPYCLLAQKLQARGLADDDMPLLNSGVIGLKKTDIGILDDSLAFMDKFYAEASTVYTLEELMLAVSARQRGVRLAECTDVIHHYWSRKRLFRAKACAWYSKHQQEPLSASALADVSQVSGVLPRPPVQWRWLYKVRTLALQAEQRQFVRELLYGCYRYPNEFDNACGPVWWEKAVENTLERFTHLSSWHIEQWFRKKSFNNLLGKNKANEVWEYLHKNKLIMKSCKEDLSGD